MVGVFPSKNVSYGKNLGFKNNVTINTSRQKGHVKILGGNCLPVIPKKSSKGVLLCDGLFYLFACADLLVLFQNENISIVQKVL